MVAEKSEARSETTQRKVAKDKSLLCANDFAKKN